MIYLLKGLVKRIKDANDCSISQQKNSKPLLLNGRKLYDNQYRKGALIMRYFSLINNTFLLTILFDVIY